VEEEQKPVTDKSSKKISPRAENMMQKKNISILKYRGLLRGVFK